VADGDYNRLVQLAQADTDAEHRQLAMSQISIIAPYVGFHGRSPADAMAAPVIDRLYPQATPSQHGDGGMAAVIAQIEAEARERIEAIIAAARAEHSENRAPVSGESDQQTAVTASSGSGD
jgi:hypothetical protein